MTAFECIYDNADFQTVIQIKIPNILVACSDLATANLLLITVEISCIGKPEQLLAKKLPSGVPKYLRGALSKPRGFLPGKCYGRLLWLAWHECTRPGNWQPGNVTRHAICGHCSVRSPRTRGYLGGFAQSRSSIPPAMLVRTVQLAVLLAAATGPTRASMVSMMKGERRHESSDIGVATACSVERKT